MPNHCYHQITFNSTLSMKQEKILKEIKKNEHGICGHYHPMPEDIRMTTCPTRIVSETEYKKIMKENEKIDRSQPYYYEPKPITKKMHKALIEKYGHDNWYEWACDDSNWGTKWGCYNTDVINHEEGILHFTTAWGPFSDVIFEMLIKDFPDVEWHWEEEQGFGATILVKDGYIIAEDDYDPIPWISIGAYNEGDWIMDICYTVGRPETMSTELVKPGFYMDYSEHEYIGDTLPMEMYNQLSEEEQEQVLKYYHSNKLT